MSLVFFTTSIIATIKCATVAVAISTVIANFMSGVETMNERRQRAMLLF